MPKPGVIHYRVPQLTTTHSIHVLALKLGAEMALGYCYQGLYVSQ